MRFSLIIYGPPSSSEASHTALNFAKATIESGHHIYRLFFYGDGVHNASNLNTASQDELDLPKEWQEFIAEYQLDAVVCIAAALKRGVLNETEAKRYQKPQGNLREYFELSGLGQLVEATVEADRIITFGH